MTAPALVSIQHNGATVYIIWNRAIAASSPLTGFTFTKNGVSNSPALVGITENALVITAAGGLVDGDDFAVTYNGGTGTIVDAATELDPAPSFGPESAVLYVDVSGFIYAVAGPTGVGNNKIQFHFGEPVAATAADLKAGFTITVNDIDVSLTSVTAALSDDASVLTFTFVSNFAYNDVIDVEYDSDDGELFSWPSDDVADFSAESIPNTSTDGLPDSGYPLSFVTKYAIAVASNVATGRLAVSLNPVDQVLVAEYGPMAIYTGGTFGVTEDNPDGIIYVGSEEDVVDGTTLTATFTFVGHVAYAVDAAKDWETVVTSRIATKLGEYRALAQSITLGDDVTVTV